ncbi:MAG: ribokinase [Microbacteriaceae bacterium]|nr:ribokinase [Microbacteriaceae bacterium]
MNFAHTGVAIVGSANMDIVFSVDRAPSPGETVLAATASLYPGGKGLNQAVASVRSGAETVFVGAIGNDSHGETLAGVITADGIDGSLLRRVADPTGQAFIVVDGHGENTIIVASGANGTVVELSPQERAAIAASAVLLMQLELPIRTVIEAAEVAAAAGTTVMLNAAPAQSLPAELFSLIDYLIVNEHEACLIAGDDDVEVASLALAAVVGRLIVTLGSAGSALYDGGAIVEQVTAFVVTPVDTTGAGDTFCGAFAAAIAEGGQFIAAAEFATAAAALSVQTLGAVPSVPQRSETLQLAATRPLTIAGAVHPTQ